jgi:hypothetical protein
MTKKTIKQRPKLPAATDEMKHRSALLAQEMLTWPGVKTGRMFGLQSVYRGTAIFALLPDKRGFEKPNGIGYKEAGKWTVLDIEGEKGIARALAVLEKAYASATGRRSSGNRE